MAHSERTKARALAMLMMGDSPKYVAEQLSLPYSTVKRWQGEAFAMWRLYVGPLDLGAFNFDGSPGTDTKKKRHGA